MNRRAFAVVMLVSLWGCAADQGAPPKSPDPEQHSKARVSARKTKPASRSSETSSWSEVQPFESSSSGSGTSKRKSRVIVTSDPAKHGDSLHFRFLVNGVPISGVFVAPGGQSTTFTIPVGTVHFTVDECDWEAQGFELAPDEEMPISCKQSKEGDCCEVAIPVDEKDAKK